MDLVDDVEQASVAATSRSRRLASSRWLWPAAFAGVAFLLLARSAFLFRARLYESADPADNSILVLQARHFTLLHGNYSRQEFFHPGPAYIYLMAAGQWLFYELTHLVPTAWNGQLIAVLLLNSALMATVAWIIAGWARSAWAAVGALAVIVGFAAALSLTVPASLNPEVLASNWMPDVYMPAFLTFLVAAASVAAGRTAHLWLLAGTGGLLVHGHAEFLFFVPVIVVAAALAALWPARRSLPSALRRFIRERWTHWAAALAVSFLFALPIAIDLALHWPGEFGKYLAYSRSARAGHHSVLDAIRYLLWFWAPAHLWQGLLVAAALVAAALLVAILVPHSAAAPGVRRFLVAGMGIAVVTTAAMLWYALRGIDNLGDYYIGFFYWSVPLLTALIVVSGLTALPHKKILAQVVLSAALVAAVGLGVAAPGLRADVHDSEPALAPAVSALAARAHGRLIVLAVAPFTAYDADGLVLAAERSGVSLCAVGPYFWVFAVTTEFLCTPEQIRAGVRYQLLPHYVREPGARIIARLRYSVLAPG